MSFFFRRVHNFVNCRHNLVIIRFFAEYYAILNLRKAGEFPLEEGKKKTMSGKRAAAWLAGIVLLGLTGCAQPVPPAAVPSGTSHTAVPERTAALEQPSGADTTVSAEMPSTAATTTTTSATTTTTVPPPSTTAPSAVQPPDKNVRTAYLTFDDGPCHHTPELLQILEEYGVKATFYVVRPADDECRGYYRQIVEAGHEIALHTYTHDYNTVYTDVDAFFADLDRIADVVEEETGVRPMQFRFPGGSSNQVSIPVGGKDIVRRIALESHRRGYVYNDWNVSSGDASARLLTAEQIFGNVTEQVKGLREPVILMHDTDRNQSTRDAVPQIIEQLQAAGYQFDTISNRSEPCQHRSIAKYLAEEQMLT